ncbi:MAG: terminase small subunit [Elusimicrobia bacterium]|nr:terminase small subunit [Elusimicrobiota bacterium]
MSFNTDSGTKKIKKLTPKQQKFVDNIVSGKNPSEAYKEAYNTENSSKETIKVNAQKLLTDTNISLTIEQKKAKIEEELIYTAKDSFLNLNFAQEKAIEQGNIQAYLKAEELKGKLLGLYTEKRDIDIKGQQTIFVDKKLDD